MLCFRLFSENNPALPLADAVAQLRKGQAPKELYAVEPASFRQIPNAPFAYWVSERIRRLFLELPAFEGEGRTVRVGLQTSDDFRFVRASWEVPLTGRMRKNHGWLPFAKGGSFSPYYADLHLSVNYSDKGRELDAFSGSVVRNPHFYLRAGITWPCRTDELSFRVLPRNAVFGHKGPSGFLSGDPPTKLLALLGIKNSIMYSQLIAAQLARVELAKSFEVGLVQSTPVPLTESDILASKAKRAWTRKRRSDKSALTSNAFNAPALAPKKSIYP
jgi:hypothetical protein